MVWAAAEVCAVQENTGVSFRGIMRDKNKRICNTFCGVLGKKVVELVIARTRGYAKKFDSKVGATSVLLKSAVTIC